MKSRTQSEDPAARAQRERERRLAELGGLETGMESADGLTEDLRKVYGLRRLGRPGAAATPGVQPAAAPMPIVEQAQRETAMDRQQQTAAMARPAAPGMVVAPNKNVVSGGYKDNGQSLMTNLWRSFVNPNQPTVSPKITTSTAPTTKTKTMSQSISKDKKR
jgi:hypothetical protein